METSAHYLQALEDQAQEQREHEGRRLRLTQRLLWMLLPALVLLLWEHVRRSTGMGVLALLAISFDLSALGLLGVRPKSRSWVLRLLTLAMAALMAVEAAFTPILSQAYSLQFVPLLALSGLLMDSAMMGVALWAVGMGIVGLAAMRATGPADGERLMLGMLAVASTASLASAWIWHGVLELAQGQLADWKDALNRHWQERQQLSRWLFKDQLDSLQRLREACRLPDALAWHAMRQELERLGELQLEAKARRQALPDPPDESLDELSFQRQALRANLLVGMAVSLVGLAIHVLTGRLNPWLALSCLGVFTLLLPMIQRPGQPKRRLLVLVLWGGLGSILYGAARGQAEGFFFMPFAIMACAMLLGLGHALAMTLLGLLALAAVTGGWNGQGGDWALQAPALTVVWLVTLGVCAQSLEQRGHLLKGLESRSRQMAADLRVQRRLLGALHHDLANLQTALLGVSDLGRAGLAEAGDWSRVRRLTERLGALLEGGEELLLGEHALPAALLQPVSLAGMAAAMHELFNERLLAKRVNLSSDVPPGLQAQGVACLLRDSVLSNLVSNAIKHSRAGSGVEIAAWEAPGSVALVVLDRGPGLGPEVLTRLERGLEQPGREGSAGEKGQGLGLLLAREHLQRLGGRLELRAREGGGTVAIAWMKAA